MALRGLNADRGRLAGRLDPPGEKEGIEGWYEPFPIDPDEEPPLEPRYFVEYPHAALLLFRAGYWIQPSARDLKVPPSILDCDYHRLVLQHPRPEQERIWAALATAARFYTCGVVACLLLLIVILRRGYGNGLFGGAGLDLFPAVPVLPFNTFELYPARLTAILLV